MKGSFSPVTIPVLYLNCPKCGGRAPMTTWKPGRGFDVGVGRCRCGVCDSEYYLIFVDLDTLAAVDAKAKA